MQSQTPEIATNMRASGSLPCLRSSAHAARLQYPLQGWQVSTGISGSFQPQSVATFDRNTHVGFRGHLPGRAVAAEDLLGQGQTDAEQGREHPLGALATLVGVDNFWRKSVEYDVIV